MRTIAHISDLHFGRVDARIAEGLAADLHALGPDVLVASGDLTQRARRWQFAAVAAYLEKLPGQRIVVPGNHDIPFWDVVRRVFSPLGRYQRYVTADLSPAHEDEELLVIGVNTARRFSWRWNGFWKDGRISKQQVAEVKGRFAQARAGAFKVLVAHHPFIPPGPRHRGDVIGGAGFALKELAGCGVDLLLAGHLHIGYSADVRGHFEAVERGIVSAQAGTAVSRRRRRNQPNGYNLIRVGAERFTIEGRTWNGERFVENEIAEYERRG